jgi:hypothetical protein
MTPESHIVDIARVIQLAIAPVFLLTALGTIVGVLSNRLARIVDRTRTLSWSDAVQWNRASWRSRRRLPVGIHFAPYLGKQRLVA